MFERTFIIAEAGSNHNGDLDTAKRLIREAKQAGADAVKFQDYSLNTLFSVDHYEKTLGLVSNKWRDEIIRTSIPPQWHEILHGEAEKIGIVYFSTPFSEGAVDALDPYVPFFKVASGDITNLLLLERIASKQKGVFVATGASLLEEIDAAVDLLKRHSLPFICIMHCVSLYPAPHNSLQLYFIDTLRERYDLPVGFSDHSIGNDASLLAVGKGIKAIERHFTLDKDQQGADHANSLTPKELSSLVEKIRMYEEMLGKPEKIITEREAKERTYARRGVYARNNLKKGERISLDNIILLRPNVAIGAEKVYDTLDRVLIRDVGEWSPIEYSMFDESQAH